MEKDLDRDRKATTIPAGDAARAGDGHAAAHQGQDDVLQVADLAQDGHEDVAVAVGHAGLGEQVVVLGQEALLGLLLVAEDLDHLLSAQHFLDVAVQVTQGGLLGHEVVGAGATHLFCHQDDDHGHGHHHQGQHPTVVDHDAEGGQHRDGAGEELGQGLGDELPQGIGVVGVVAHHVPVGVGVKIADGQGLHVVEHVIPDGLQAALGDQDHQAAVEEGTHHADEVDGGHGQQHPGQTRENGVLLQQQGGNVLVHQYLHEHGTADVGHRGDQHAQAGQGEDALGMAGDVGHEAVDGGGAVLGLVGHCGSSPFCWEV